MKVSEIPSEVADKIKFGRPINSPYELAYVYGRLRQTELVLKGIGEDVASFGNFERLFNNEYFELSRNTILVPVDFEEEEVLLDEIQVETVSELERMNDFQYSGPASRMGGPIDFSSSYFSTGKKSDKVGGYASTQFTNWAKKYVEYVEDPLEWVETMKRMGEDEQKMEKLENNIETLIEDEFEGEFTGLLSICGWEDEKIVYPGSLPGHMEVVKALFELKKYSNAESNSKESETVDMITGDIGTVIGGDTSPPLNMWAVKQEEKHPDFDSSRTWERRPLSLETIAVLETGSQLFSEFSEYISALSDDSNDVMLYSVPFFQKTSIEDACMWYSELVSRDEDSDVGIWEKIENESDFLEAMQEKKLASFGALTVDTGQKEKVLNFGVNSSIGEVNEKAKNIYEENMSWLSLNGFWNPVSLNGSFLRLVATGEFLLSISGVPQDIGGSKSVNSNAVNSYKQFLFGSKINFEELIQGFSTRLEYASRNREITSSSSDGFVDYVMKQYIVISALDSTGLLHNCPKSLSFIEGNGTIMSSEEDSEDGMTQADSLEQFIEAHPVLAEDEEQRAAFLLGGLVGRMTAIQQNNNVSMTLTSQYPVENVTKRNFENIVQEVMNKFNVYADSGQYSVSHGSWKRYREPIVRLMEMKQPTEWSLSDSTIKYQYSLGITYGYFDSS